jgi:hypothetical protein
MCQLPPVNEPVSGIFNKQPAVSFQLSRVERAQGLIVEVSNHLRDGILSNKQSGFIAYLKDRPDPTIQLYTSAKAWLETFCKLIVEGKGDKLIMGLTWTNKRGTLLNAKIRESLWIQSKLESTIPLIIKGERIIIRDAYYQYGDRCYGSMILTIAKEPEPCVYRPQNVLEWINCGAHILKAKTVDNELAYMPIIDDKAKPLRKTVRQKTMLDYGVKRETPANPSAPPAIDIKAEKRVLFLAQNNYMATVSKSKILTAEIRDDYLMNTYPGLFPSAHQLSSEEYKNFHMWCTRYLFGVPIEKTTCGMCEFLASKLVKLADTPIIARFIALFKDLELGAYSCQTTCGRQLNIFDRAGQAKYDELECEVNAILAEASVHTVKCNKTEMAKLRRIFEELGAEPMTHITLSYVLGHYWNHVIRDVFARWDYGYFITVHKSQGSEYDTVFLDFHDLVCNPKPSEQARLIYTGFTRARTKCHIYC